VKITDLPYVQKLLQNFEAKPGLASKFSPKALLSRYAKTKVYHPVPFSESERADSFRELREAGIDIEVKELHTIDGNKIAMWFGKRPEKKAPTKIFFHGRKSHIGHLVNEAKKAYEDGYNVCMFSYRGHSGNEGYPSEAGVINDAMAVFEELIDQRKIPAESIDIEAESFGCSVALHALAKRSLEVNRDFHYNVFNDEPLGVKLGRVKERFNHITLKSPFSSIREMSKYEMTWLPHALKKWFLDDMWNNLEAVRHLANVKHITFLHGDKDTQVPIQESRKLFEQVRALGIPANFITASGETHRFQKQTKSYIEENMLQASLPYKGNYAHISDGVKTHQASDGQEHAVDVPMPIGTPVYAMRPGRVLKIIDNNPDINESEQVFNFDGMNEVIIEDSEGVTHE
jgi:fermentation-respiration switch protein FrsA (DUF1100 family)